MLTLPIREVAAVTPRALAVRLDLGHQAFTYRAGQAVVVGRADQPVRRPYSVAVAPHQVRANGCLELLVGLDSDGSPGPQWGDLQPGTRIEVDGPVGTFHFPDAPMERRFLFVAGGTGIAPLRAMLHDALARGDGWDVSMVYSARTTGEFAYGSELRALAATGRIRLWQTVTREPADAWTGKRGRIARHHLEELVLDPATLCFVCGPHALVTDVPLLLQEVGVAPERIRVEDWGS
jgi:Na+-transporting NADH:ubiquinone oxidoreductase subunit F